ncbi:MAG: hypothetical protein AAFR45_02640 [Pseudomonadota bacterium]
MQNAHEIYQENLDLVSRAFWHRRFDLLPKYLGIPNQVITKDEEIVISSADELICLMQDFREKLITLGGYAYRRECQEAVFANERKNVILGRHQTFLLNADEAVIGTYENRMTLMRIEDRWLGVRIDSSAENKTFNVVSPDFAEAQRREFEQLNQRPQTPTTE